MNLSELREELDNNNRALKGINNLLASAETVYTENLFYLLLTIIERNDQVIDQIPTAATFRP